MPLTLQQFRNRSFTKTYLWQFSFVDVPPVLRGEDPDPSIFTPYAENIDFPRKTNTPAEIRAAGFKIKSPGAEEVEGSMTATFYETDDMVVSRFFSKWKRAQFEPFTGKQAKTKDISATIKLDILNGQREVIYTYKIVGVWIEGFDPGGQLDSTTSDPLRCVVTFSYDEFVEGYPGDPILSS